MYEASCSGETGALDVIVDEGEVTLFSALDARSTSVAQRWRKRKRPAPESDPEGWGEV